MSTIVIPTVGSSGYFELKAPLDILIVQNERYTCKAVRNLSDYFASNEDPKTDIYTKYNIPEDEYTQDIKDDTYIVSLQSEKGHWLYVPVKYIVGYPITNGVPYRSIMIGISLPSIQADRDLSFLETDLTNLIKDALGVIPVIKQIETSRVVLVSKEKHDIVQAERNALSSSRVTDRSRYMSLMTDNQIALNKIRELEAYIKTHYVATP